MRKVRLMSLLTLFLLMGAGFIACNNVKDSDLENKVVEVLATNPDATHVNVSVMNKVATLSGSVADDAAKSYVESAVVGVKGIKSVINNIVIVPPAPDFTEMDAFLRTALPDVLKDHPTVHAEVKDGIIILTGEVKEKELPMVMEKVSALNPVKVENNITVK